MAEVTVFRVYCFHKVAVWVFWWHTKSISLAQLPTNPIPIGEADILKMFDTFGKRICISWKDFFIMWLSWLLRLYFA